MRKKKLISLLLVYLSPISVYAQWTEKDSLWLDGVLSGKEQIRLNPETMKAIREGTFINTDPSVPKLLSAPPILPISQEFDIAPQDTLFGDTIDYRTMPPAVYALYRHHKAAKSDTIERLLENAFSMPDLTDKERVRIGKSPVTIAAKAENIYNDAVKDGQKRGGFTGSARVTFSLNDILMGIFNKTERNKRRNKKRAQAWKTYNDFPAPAR